MVALRIDRIVGFVCRSTLGQLMHKQVCARGCFDDGIAWCSVAGDDQLGAVLFEHKPKGWLHVAVIDFDCSHLPVSPSEGAAVLDFDDVDVHDVITHTVVQTS